MLLKDYLSSPLMKMCIFLEENLKKTEKHKIVPTPRVLAVAYNFPFWAPKMHLGGQKKKKTSLPHPGGIFGTARLPNCLLSLLNSSWYIVPEDRHDGLGLNQNFSGPKSCFLMVGSVT